MKIELTKTACIVTKEPGEPKMYRSGHASTESPFLYRVKEKLIEMGHDVIKKRMWKDGHLVADEQQYIRTRHGVEPSFMIWNAEYALFDARAKFNDRGEVKLAIEWDIWKGE